MVRLELLLLGPPRIELNNEAVALNERKAIALLIYLVINPKPHSRDALSTLLWPESDQSRARANLRYTLWSLRKAIGGDLIQGEGQELWVDAGIHSDVFGFRDRVARWRSHEHSDGLCTQCVMALDEAVALYTDDFLAGFTLDDSPAFDEWTFFEAETYRRELIAALDALIHHHRMTKSYESAIEHARRRLALDPLHEPVHRTLMELYAAIGQRASALRQYDECTRLLRQELNVDPDEETASLARAIRRRTAPGSLRLDPSAAPPTPERRDLNQLPEASTPFVGRGRELRQVVEVLTDANSRLVTIIGPGGIGKSRLALEAANAVRNHFADGVCWIPLVGFTSSELLPLTILQALGQSVVSVSSSRAELLEYLRGKAHLLILDNFEQLLAAVPLLVEMLEAASDFKLLVTSRERLHLRQEWILPLGGLGMNGSESHTDPDGYQEALALLLQCARRYRSDLKLDESDMATAHAVCRMVGGSPLAIEHVAAWLRAASIQIIQEELNRGLTILVSDEQDTPERHRSMETVLESSWRTLTPNQQSLLRQLSLFRSPFTLQAAQAIGSGTLTALASLIDASWLQVSGDSRYMIHELARQYAYEKLLKEHEPATGEAPDEVRTRFSHFYASLLHKAESTHSQMKFIHWKELDSIWYAWDWAVRQSDSMAISAMTRTLFDFCRSGFRQTTMERVRSAIAHLRRKPQEKDQLQITRLALARLLSVDAHLTALLGSLEMASVVLEEAYEIISEMEPSPERSEAMEDLLLTQAYLSIGLGKYARVEQILSGDPIRRSAGETLPGLHYRAYAYKLLGRLDEAEHLMRKQMQMTGASNDDFLPHSVDIACDRGDLDEAVACLQRQQRELEIADASGLSTRYGLQHLTYQIHRGKVAALAGDWEVGRHAFEQANELGQITDYKLVSIRGLEGLGGVELDAGNFEAALANFEQARDLSMQTARWRNLGIALIGIARAELALERLDRAHRALSDAGEALDRTEATPIKLDRLVALAEVRRHEGEPEGIGIAMSSVLAHPAAVSSSRMRALELLAWCGVEISEADIEVGDYFDDLASIAAHLK